jgi:O-antigen/teichoic acid export membrane protein
VNPTSSPEERLRAVRTRGATARSSRLEALRSSGARGGLVMTASMLLGGAMDYGVNVLSGRWLEPAEFGVFVAVTALLQVLLTLSLAIRMVVAFYTARITAHPGSNAQAGAFMRRALGWSWRWGLVAMVVMVVASVPLARALQVSEVGPLWVASAMVLMLCLREALYGALQGVQAFAGLGLVQLTQAVLRLLSAAALMWAGARATGAIAALPIGAIGALGLGLWWLRGYLREPGEASDVRVDWSYALTTVTGLALLGLLANLDALFVKHYFAPGVAGNYGTVVTFEKVALFLPLAVGLILFPKVAQRVAARRDTRPLLLVALGAALAPGLGVTCVYFLWPGLLVRTVFSHQYSDPGVVLGLASLAATLYAGIHIWLNYALSTGRRVFVVAMGAVMVGQAAGMFAFGRESLVGMAWVMVAGGIVGNIAGYLTTWTSPVRAPAVPAEGG